MQLSNQLNMRPCINHAVRGQEIPLMFTMGEKCDLSYTGMCMAWLLMPDRLVSERIFMHNTLYTEWCEKKKLPVSGSCAGGNVLLMKEVRGEWPDWLKVTKSLQ